MILRRFITRLFPALLFCLASTPCCFANKNADIPKFTPPVQNYAVIDISGDKATNVVLIGLNDANQASFDDATELFTYYPPGAGDLYKYHNVYTWQNGTLGVKQTTLGHDDTPMDNPLEDLYVSKSPAVFHKILGTGMLVGHHDRSEMDHEGYWLLYRTGCTAFNGVFSDSDIPNPPFLYSDLCELEDASEHGPKIGYGAGGIDALGVPMNIGADFLEVDGNCTLFLGMDGALMSGFTPLLPDNWVLEPTEFTTNYVNKNGWVLGYTYEYGYDEAFVSMWEGKQGMVAVGLGYTGGLNDQGQAVIQGTLGGLAPLREGYFWENGSPTVFLNKMPIWIAGQYSNIQPFSISNQVKPAPPSTVLLSDPTINILTEADGVDVGAYGKMLWTRDKDGKWTFANVALPEGTTIDTWTSINSSGVIAAIGNGRHALLLFPMDARVYDTIELSTDVDNGIQEKYRVFQSDPNDITGHKTKNASELKIAQWENLFNYSGGNWVFNPGDMTGDVDAFFVRVIAPPPPTGTNYQAKVWTESSDANYSDGGATVDLKPVPGQLNTYQSAALSLVADDEDDQQIIATTHDGQLNDQTYKCNLGSVVKISLLNVPGLVGSTQESLSVKVKKTVHAVGYILNEGLVYPTSVCEEANANYFFQAAADRLAQCGIKLTWDVKKVANPKGLKFGGLAGAFNAPTLNASGQIVLTNDAKLVLDDPSLQISSENIAVYFVSQMSDAGDSIVQSALPTVDQKYANKIFASVDEMTHYTLAHECLHLLLNAVHGGPSQEWIHYNRDTNWCLWFTSALSGNDTGVAQRKRIIDTMRSRTLKSPLLK